MNLDEFKVKFNSIIEMGWIKTHRSGNTGIGKTLEDLLDIEENNIQGPDFDIYELKASRKSENAYLTLITQAPSPRGYNSILRRIGGYPQEKNGKLINCLRTTLYYEIENELLNGNKLTYIINTNSQGKKEIRLKLNGKLIDGFWDLESIAKKMKKKLSNLVYVLADNKYIGNDEYFKFEKAVLLKKDDFTVKSLEEALQEGLLLIDIRLGQYENGLAHDHGTAIRIKKGNKYKLYNYEELE
ncbi:MAG: MvaI/BcnI family restriction endonuclease [Acholeplasma sp.]|nr:MvaI/BcnI family restriction endonuclease [Acholeplasma sp.]